jgi:hypothetical protein
MFKNVIWVNVCYNITVCLVSQINLLTFKVIELKWVSPADKMHSFEQMLTNPKYVNK